MITLDVLSLIWSLLNNKIIPRDLILREDITLDYELCKKVASVITLTDVCDVEVLIKMLESKECASIALDTIAHCIRDGSLSLLSLIEKKPNFIKYSPELLKFYDPKTFSNFNQWSFYTIKKYLRTFSLFNPNDIIYLLALLVMGDYAIKEIVVKVISDKLREKSEYILKWIIENEKGGVRKIAAVRLLIYTGEKGAMYLLEVLDKQSDVGGEEDIISALSYAPIYASGVVNLVLEKMIRAFKTNPRLYRYLPKMAKLCGKQIMEKVFRIIYEEFIKAPSWNLLLALSHLQHNVTISNEEDQKLLSICKEILQQDKADTKLILAIADYYTSKTSLTIQETNLLKEILVKVKNNQNLSISILERISNNLPIGELIKLSKKDYTFGKKTIKLLLSRLNEKKLKNFFESMNVETTYLTLEALLEEKSFDKITQNHFDFLVNKLDEDHISKIASFIASRIDNLGDLEAIAKITTNYKLLGKVAIVLRDLDSLKKLKDKYPVATKAINWLEKIVKKEK